MLTIGNPVARRRIQRRAPRIACAITSGWREGISPRQLRPMSPEEYLERAEHFRKAAAEASVSSFTRWHLETMERSYRTSGRERGRASSVRPRGRGASKAENGVRLPQLAASFIRTCLSWRKSLRLRYSHRRAVAGSPLGSARGFCIGSTLEPTQENLETVRHIQSASALS